VRHLVDIVISKNGVVLKLHVVDFVLQDTSMLGLVSTFVIKVIF